MNNEEAAERHRWLTAEGWERRFSAEEPRLSEMADYYRSLGLEVRVEQGALGDDEQCRSCFDAEGFGERYKTIYTRGEASPKDSDEGLVQ